MSCEHVDCGVCPARARLAAFVERFAMVPEWDPEAEKNDPAIGGQFALAMLKQTAGEARAREECDVVLYDTLQAALDGAAINVAEGWLPEQILDTSTGEVYRPGIRVTCTASVDPAYRVEI